MHLLIVAYQYFSLFDENSSNSGLQNSFSTYTHIKTSTQCPCCFVHTAPIYCLLKTMVVRSSFVSLALMFIAFKAE